MEVELTSIEKAKSLLKQLFRSENADLDFGIYRIMNYKRTEIEKFIDKDLIAAAEAEFREFAKAGTTELKKQLEKLKAQINEVAPKTIDENWNVTKNFDSPKVKEFLSVLRSYNEASVSEEQVQDVFNHVYDFFSRYYIEGDFIPRTRYGGHNKYFIPYNGEEVLLHWATKDMYYIKTSEHFKKYNFKAGKFRVTFILVDAQIEQGNVKAERKYFILHSRDPVFLDETSEKIEIRFNYRPLTEEEKEKYSSTKAQDELIDEAIINIGVCLGKRPTPNIFRSRSDEEKPLIRKHLEAYVKRNTKDFFIHKNLRSFLLRELNSYLRNEVWNFDELISNSGSQTQMMAAKAKAIRGISKRIIEFLAQIEEFQKRLFEKKKFVLRTDYCITLDLIPEEFYEEIGKNQAQIKEWKRLFDLDKITHGTFLSTKHLDTFKKDFMKKLPNLVLDTKHFKSEFKWRLLSKINDLDRSIDGIIIKSENYQCLNLLSTKYEGSVGCIYIDPPYNTGKDGFLYKDQFFHSSWLSMMENTAELSNTYLANEGFLLSSIGNQELDRLISLFANTYGETNFVGLFVWVNEGNIDNQSKIKQNHEYILGFAKDESDFPHPTVIDPNIPKDSKLYKKKVVNTIIKNGPKNPISEIKLPIGFPVEIEEGSIIPNTVEWPKFEKKVMVKNGKITEPMRIRSGWSSKRLLEEFIDNNFEPIYDNRNLKTTFILTEKGVPYIVKERSENPGHVLTVLHHMGTTQSESRKLKSMGINFTYPKPVKLIKYLISAVSRDDSMILDYFAGSGPVAEAVLDLNEKNGKRKYLLIDMDDSFDSVLKIRIKKIMFTKEWKKGIPTSKPGYSHIMKYQYVEQYEDTLNNVDFTKKDGSIQSRLERLPDYFIKYMLDYETRDSPTRLSFSSFRRPFDYRIKTLSGGEEKEEAVDLVETFNYLLGIQIQKLRSQKDGDRLYRVVFGERNHEKIAIIWRNTIDLDLRKDKEFIEKTILAENHPDTVYINGDSYLESAKPIEPEFKRLMGV